MKVKMADGVTGHLIFAHGTGKHYFRVYDKSRGGSFTDYDIWHSDLVVTIVDNEAYFYEREDGRMILDHSPATLGLEIA